MSESWVYCQKKQFRHIYMYALVAFACISVVMQLSCTHGINCTIYSNFAWISCLKITWLFCNLHIFYQVMREFFENSPSRNASSSEPTITADFEVMRQRLLDCLDSFTRFNANLQLQYMYIYIVFQLFPWCNVVLLSLAFGEYLTLNDWSRGEQWILFPENLNVSREEANFEFWKMR